MKLNKIISLLILVLSVISVTAQTNDSVPTPKKNGNYLPKAGDVGIGIDATPVFNFMGNLFNGATNNTLDISSPVLYGKYYLTDKTALRAVLNVQSTNRKDLSYIRDDAAFFLNPLSNKQVTDSRSISNQQYFVSLAWQRFIGNGRLRGFFGAQVLYGYNYNKTSYAYGNPMSVANPTPSTVFTYNNDHSRVLQSIDVNAYNVGGGAIGGFEYYVMPRLCIGGELSLNLIFSKGNQLSNKTEKVVSDAVVKSDMAVSPGSNDISISTSRFTPNGYQQQLGFYVMFHF